MYLFLEAQGNIRRVVPVIPLLVVTSFTWGIEGWKYVGWYHSALISFSVYLIAPLLGAALHFSVRYHRRRGVGLNDCPSESHEE
jgi:hypothetical protein